MATVPSVAVYVTDSAVFIISQLMTDHGRVSSEPMLKLDRRASAEDLGNAVLRCLGAFAEKDGPPPPNHFEELKRFVGARNWRAFTRKALSVSVEGRSDKIVSLAVARADEHGAYAYGPASECRRDAASIGGALRQLTGIE